MKNKLMAHNGSVQNIEEIPKNIRELYKTVWEMKGKVLIDMAADRGIYVDQSQSFNVHMENINFGKLTSMHFYAWKRGLKTGMYYLRSQAAVDAIKVTVDHKLAESASASNTKTEEVSKTPISTPQRTPTSTPIKSKPSPFGIVRDGKASPAHRSLDQQLGRNHQERVDEEEAQIQRWRAEREKQRQLLLAVEANSEECLNCGS